MNEQEMMLRRIATLDFAIVELNLYMDTHPDDRDINIKLNDYKQQSDALKVQYQEKYGPLTSRQMEENRWGWISDPWPWNNDENSSEGDAR